MDSFEASWEQRQCLRAPIPQMDEAAGLLSQACDAYLAHDHGLARALLRQADMPEVHRHASELMGKLDPVLHRLRPVAASAEPAGTGPRMPALAAQRRVFERDGFRCRFCGCRVVLPAARSTLRDALPGAIDWGRTNAEKHAAFYALSATADHVVPHAKGGTSDPGNIVTTCQGCNFGRGGYLLAEMGLADPREREPMRDGWDGLSRVLSQQIANPATNKAAAFSTAKAEPRFKAMNPAQWLAAFDGKHPGCSVRLQALLTRLERFGVSPGGKKCLIFRLRSPYETLDVFGIDLDGRVNIPWFFRFTKVQFRPFAEALAAALPDAVVTPSDKQWIVKNRDGSPVRITDLLDIADTVEAAFAQLHAALHAPG